jgi:hypothetical protein
MLRNWSARIKRLQERFGIRIRRDGLEHLMIVDLAEGETLEDIEFPPGITGVIAFPYLGPGWMDVMIAKGTIEMN